MRSKQITKLVHASDCWLSCVHVLRFTSISKNPTTKERI